MSRLFVAICILIGLTHSLPTALAAADDGPIVIGNTVVFPYHTANEGPELSRIGMGQADWTPDSELVALVDDQLVEFLAKKNDGKKILMMYSDYRRQYVGINQGHFILINSFCYDDRNGDSWKKKIIHIFGGGICYFTVLYDVVNGSFLDFRQNADY